MKTKQYVFLIFVVFLICSEISLSQTINSEDSNNNTEKSVSFGSYINNREVVARIYHNWGYNRENYEKITCISEGDIVNFNISYADESTKVVVLKNEQTDEAIKEVMYEMSMLYSPNGKMKLYEKKIQKNVNVPRGIWTFKDSIGNPVSIADGEVYISRNNEKETWAVSFITDENGQCISRYSSENRYTAGTLSKTTVIIYINHPDYGTQRFFAGSDYDQVFTLPCVKRNSKAYERSVRGYVLDGRNNRLAGVPVILSRITLPGEYNMITGCSIYTNEEGYFDLYPPNYSKNPNALVPDGTIYWLFIQPPRETGLAPCIKKVTNSKLQDIRLTTLGYFHRLVFETKDGEITDPKILSDLRLTIDTDEETEIEYQCSTIQNGRLLPTGTYNIFDRAGKYEFDSIEVKEDSPEQIVFKSKYDEGITFFGKVIDGITGEPFDGAFVNAKHSANIFNTKGFLTEITDKEWEFLWAVQTDDSTDKEVLKELGKTFISTKIVRTDSKGEFKITVSPDDIINEHWGIMKAGLISKLVVFDKDYLGVEIYTELLETDDKKKMEMPVFALFPAAQAEVTLSVPENMCIVQKWIINDGNQPKWFKSLEKEIIFEFDDSNQSVEEIIARSNQMEKKQRPYFSDLLNSVYCRFTATSQNICLEGKNRVLRFPVPADIEFQLQIKPYGYSYEGKYGYVLIPQTLKLKQGEVIDLGSYEIPSTIRVFVSVLDTQGNPVEGIPVAVLEPTGSHIGPFLTGEQGCVYFLLSPNSTGQFEIGQKWGKVIKSLDYEIIGEESKDKVFQMALTQEEINFFRK